MEPIQFTKLGDVYTSVGEFVYTSVRYGRQLTIPDDYPSNGANVVKDRCATAFFCHDFCCNEGAWDNDIRMCNREASFVYHDILVHAGYPFLAKIRWIGTFLFGGGQARKNGMWRVK